MVLEYDYHSNFLLNVSLLRTHINNLFVLEIKKICDHEQQSLSSLTFLWFRDKNLTLVNDKTS